MHDAIDGDDCMRVMCYEIETGFFNSEIWKWLFSQHLCESHQLDEDRRSTMGTIER
jgi:hypothetical protein